VSTGFRTLSLAIRRIVRCPLQAARDCVLIDGSDLRHNATEILYFAGNDPAYATASFTQRARSSTDV
jgi:hypothetical protein